MKTRSIPLGDKNLIGANVARLRNLHNMSQKELAASMQVHGADINYTSLSKLEGQTRAATDKELLALAQIFSIPMEELFRATDDTPK